MATVSKATLSTGAGAAFLISIQKEIAQELSISLDLKVAAKVVLEHLLRIDNFCCGTVLSVKHDWNLTTEAEAGDKAITGKLPGLFNCISALLKETNELSVYPGDKSIEPCTLVMNALEGVKSFILSPVKLNNEIVAAIVLFSETTGEHDILVIKTVEAVSAKIGGIIGRIDYELLLLEHQKNLDSLFNGISDMMFIVNSESKIIHFNPVALQKLGYTEEEFSNISLNQIHPPELSFDVKNTFEKALEGKQSLALFPVLTASGELIPAETTYSPGKWDGKNMIFLVIRDMRERKIAKEEITLARKKAEEANRAKTVFLANMSHAFRIPLNSIIGMSELLLKTDLTKKQFNFLNVIIKSTENLIIIVNDLLDVSRIEAGEIILQNNAFSVKDVIATVINNQFFNIRYKGIELLSDFLAYSDDIIVKGDSARLIQILSNLIENAIKYTSRGKVEINTRIAGTDGETIILYFDVVDTGSGINPDRLKEIYSSIENNRPVSSDISSGSGLGLVISSKLTEMMGGKLHIETEPEKGSAFSFTVKLTKATKDELSGMVLYSGDSDKIQSMDNIRILLAEDQEFNQMVVQSMILDWGFKIDIVENGLQVLEKLKTEKYDVILMDIQMPKLNGLEATKRIRCEFPKPVCDIPIIAITANAYCESHRQFIEAGMTDTISKPFKSQVLFHKIANVIGMSESNFFHPTSNFSDADAMFFSREEQLYDLTLLNGISKNNRQTVTNMLNVFIEKATEELSQIKAAGKEENWQMLSAVAHKMKPALAYLGMKSLEKIVNELQFNAKNLTNLDKTPQMIQNAEALLNKIITQLKNEISDGPDSDASRKNP